MNTILTSITNTIKTALVSPVQQSELTKEQFIAFRDAFKSLAHSKQLTSRDIILYNVIRGLPVDRGFTPITNQNKLRNGSIPNATLEQSKWSVMILLRSQLDYINNRFGNFLGVIPPKGSVQTQKSGAIEAALRKQSYIAADLYETIKDFTTK